MSREGRNGARSRLFAVVAFISASIWALLAVGIVGMNTLTGLRGYVNGEALWAKHQKDATQQLLRYVHSRDRAAYHRFRESLDVLQVVETSRLELESDEPDLSVVSAGFLELGIHPADHGPMTVVFRRFRNFEHMKTAVETWERGDRLVDDLQRLGDSLYAEMSGMDSVSAESVEESMLSILEINTRLSTMEAEFSLEVGRAARWARGVLIKVMFGFCLSAGVVCALLAALGARIISRAERSARDLVEERLPETGFLRIDTGSRLH
jgi:hypothetical protein